eukprot:6048220-Amphidinium_carterae.1
MQHGHRIMVCWSLLKWRFFFARQFQTGTDFWYPGLALNVAHPCMCIQNYISMSLAARMPAVFPMTEMAQ